MIRTGFPGHMDQSHIYKTMQEAITGSATRPLASGTIVGKEDDNIIYANITDDTIIANSDGTNYIFANRGRSQKISGGDTLIQLGWRFTGHPQGCAVGSSGDR
jgi:hypothetical protein